MNQSVPSGLSFIVTPRESSIIRISSARFQSFLFLASVLSSSRRFCSSDNRNLTLGVNPKTTLASLKKLYLEASESLSSRNASHKTDKAIGVLKSLYNQSQNRSLYFCINTVSALETCAIKFFQSSSLFFNVMKEFLAASKDS